MALAVCAVVRAVHPAPDTVVPANAGIHGRHSLAKRPTVYILASRPNGTLYVGVTSDPVKRIREYRNGLIRGFTKRYGVHRLVYLEVHGNMSEAIRREKRIKKWRRVWRMELIAETNPLWQDLWPTIVGDVEMDSRFRGNDGSGSPRRNESLDSAVERGIGEGSE